MKTTITEVTCDRCGDVLARSEGSGRTGAQYEGRFDVGTRRPPSGGAKETVTKAYHFCKRHWSYFAQQLAGPPAQSLHWEAARRLCVDWLDDSNMKRTPVEPFGRDKTKRIIEQYCSEGALTDDERPTKRDGVEQYINDLQERFAPDAP